ncbi:hypothetical protein GKZ90_0005875 [Flavobacterium sp. MC2016-06]|uniref:hypothetical protein n=1 Tax=Flavobacterium sp. MC2016-06 TaxID=2676308 RepID=UPI0012BADD94|nr:hypothetical protein [Flavobacterium sp. MC2016-06]MBU3857666.1 hypothetical protein [Flavobacterium sp. MC2016-06]
MGFNYNQIEDDEMVKHHTHEIDLLNICGGIPIDYANNYLLDINYDNHSFELALNSPEHNVERTLNIRNKSIRNDFMQVYSTGYGIGTNIFINQIIQARKLGIKVFFVSAAKGATFNGYYTWARMGYDFIFDEDKNQFKELIFNNSRTETSLFELMQTVDGRSFWKTNGFWWEGQFMIQPGSKNINALNNYLIQAGIGLSL